MSRKRRAGFFLLVELLPFVLPSMLSGQSTPTASRADSNLFAKVSLHEVSIVVNAQAVEQSVNWLLGKNAAVARGIAGLLKEELDLYMALHPSEQDADYKTSPASHGTRLLVADVVEFGPPRVVNQYSAPRKAAVIIRYTFSTAENPALSEKGEVHGLSADETRNFAAFRLGGDGPVDMLSPQFAMSLIGQATLDACQKLVAQYKKSEPRISSIR